MGVWRGKESPIKTTTLHKKQLAGQGRTKLVASLLQGLRPGHPYLKATSELQGNGLILKPGFYDSGDLPMSLCQLRFRLISSFTLISCTVTTARVLSYFLHLYEKRVPQIVIDIDKTCIENTKLKMLQLTYGTNWMYQ